MATLTLVTDVRDYEAELEALRIKYEQLRGRYQEVVHERDRLDDQRTDQLEVSTLVCDGDACATELMLIATPPVERTLLRLAGRVGWKQSAIPSRHFCPACAKKFPALKTTSP
jgi:hypothetical protein